MTDDTTNDDDLLDPEQIEDLLANRESEPVQSPGTSSANADLPTDDEQISQSDLDDLFQSSQQAASAGPEVADLAELLGTGSGLNPGSPLPTQPFQLPSLQADHVTADEAKRLASLRGVELDLSIELGRAEMLLDNVVRLEAGSVVPLDKLAGDPVDILVNGKLIARGEVLVLNDNFCVRVAEILTPKQ